MQSEVKEINFEIANCVHYQSIKSFLGIDSLLPEVLLQVLLNKRSVHDKAYVALTAVTAELME